MSQTVIEGARRLIRYLHDRKRAYQLAFGSPAGQEVLADLAKFCRANETCFNADPRMHAVAEGRREVWLRIRDHLELTPEQLLYKYSRGEMSVNDLKGTEYAR